ncbi:hypothetical protein [Klebsiella aerogenes]|uniref:hypothetical protein n=1 Tax=Klebsiella aerogenes TaxID=548 RepID=UPI0034D30277
MNIEQLEAFLQVAGRYQVYSDGEGHYHVMPVPETAIEITPNADNQLSACSCHLIYNNQMG